MYFLRLAQAMTTQVQHMAVQANWEVGPRVNQNSNTLASHLRDFTGMNPPMFFLCKVNEYTQDFLNEVYKILMLRE